MNRCGCSIDSRHGCRLVLRSLDPHRRRGGVRDPPARRAPVPLRRRPAPLHAQDPARERPPHRQRRRRGGGGDVGRPRRAEPGDLLLARPSPPPGLHRRPGGRRPRGDARRDGRSRRRGGEDQPADPGRARDRPLRPGRRVRHARRVPPERRPRVRAELRALRLPPLGPGGIPRLQGRAARHRDRAPGQPRVPRARDRDARRRGVPGHARRHRLAHDDGQRARRSRLGRGRDRGRGGDARRGGLDARSPGRRLPALGRAPGRRDRDRPRPDGDSDPPRDGRRRQVRRVLRPRPRRPAARRPRDAREHVARVRRHLRLLPRRRGDAQVPAPDGAGRATGRPRRGLLQGEPALARPVRDGDVLTGGRARPDDRRAVARRSAPSAGSRAAPHRQGVVRRGARHVRRHLPGRLARQGGGELLPRLRPARRDDTRRAAEHDRGGSAGARRARHRLRRDHRQGRGRLELRARPRRGRDRRDHLVHEHVEPGGDGRSGAARQEGRRARARPQALGEDEPRARLQGRDRLLRPRRSDAVTSRSSASTRSATAARPASGTPGRCPSRSPEPSTRGTSSRAPCSRETATSRRGSIPR